MTVIYNCTRKTTILLTLALFFTFGAKVYSQVTPGIIFKSAVAGKTVLDPNGDGYVSTSNLGFTSNDVSQSEIPFRPLPQVSLEPMSDIKNGPNGGFTDFADNGSQNSVLMYIDGSNNLVFRFRLGGAAPNSKGYSVLFDIDQKFGMGVDPNAVSGNPGFEFEVELATNFGVRFYDVDGTSSPTLKTTLSYDDYSQKSVAYTTNSSNIDVYYDFYIPLSTIQTYYPSFSLSTPVRLVANTVIAPQSAIKGPLSDVSGINDASYGNNPDAMWNVMINNYKPTALSVIQGGGYFPAGRTATPVVTSPVISGATTVSGTSSEANGTKIYIYVNSALRDSTTVSSGAWSKSSLAGTTLASNDTIYATALASSKSLSDVSGKVVVGSTCSAAPTITCNSAKGIEITVPSSTVTSGMVIKIYQITSSGLSFVGYANNSVSTYVYIYKCNGSYNNCNSGSNCMTDGVYTATLQESGKCESSIATPICQGTSGSTSTPTLSTTSISTASTSVSGTSANSASVFLYKNGYLISTKTANSSTGAFTFSGLSIANGDTLKVNAIDGSKCISSFTSNLIASLTTSAPVVNSPIYTSSTSISGTSDEASGTSITIYKNGTSIGSATLNSYGTWTLSSVSGLSSGDAITAKATATGEQQSVASNSVTVLTQTANVPTISGTYTEAGTSVSGTSSSANGTTITIYEDGYSIGTTTVSSSAWSLTGLSSSSTSPALYAGGVLTATATETGKGESSYSSSKTVGCATIASSNSVTVMQTPICSGQTTQIKIGSTTSGIIYTIRDNTNTSYLASSVLGNGSDLTITTYAMTSSNRFKSIYATEIGASVCTQLLSKSDSVTVFSNPTSALTLGASSNPACSGLTNNVTVASSQVGVKYQLKLKSTGASVGSAVAGNGSTLSIPTGVMTSTTTYQVVATDTTHPTYCSSTLNDTIRITVSASATPAPGSSSSICNGSSASIGATSVSGVTYSWSSNPSGFSSTSSSATVSPTTTTTYRLTATLTSTGCARKDSVKITVNALPTPTPGSASIVCSGSSATIGGTSTTGHTYSWASNPAGFSSTSSSPSVSPTVATYYKVTETITSTGCSKTDSVKISVNALPTPTPGSATSTCSGTPVSVGGSSTTGHTYSWTSNPSGFTSTSSNPSVSPSVTTVYRVTETITSTGCSKTDSVKVTVNTLSTPSFSVGDANVCRGASSKTYSVSSVANATTYTWTVPTNWTINSGQGTSSISLTFDTTTTGTISVVASASGYCSSAAATKVIAFKARPAGAVASSQTICNGTSVNIGAPSVTNSTYSWSSSPSGISSTSSNPSVSPTTTTTYTLTESNTGFTCTRSNNVTVTVNALPTPAPGSASTVCSGTAVTIGAASTSGHTYSWTSNPSGFTSTSSNPSVSPATTTTYRVTETITSTGCSKTDSVKISTNALPTPTPGSATAICNGSSVTIGGVSTSGHTYSWTSNPSGFTSTTSNPSVSPTITTTYRVTESITSTGCSKSDSVKITVNALPTPTPGSAIAICNGSSATIGGSSTTGHTYSWTSNPSGFSSTSSTQSVNPTTTTTYKVTETITSTGCSKSDSVKITVKALPTPTPGSATSICNGSSLTIGGTSTSGHTYSWTSNPSGFSSPSSNPTVSPTTTTTYKVTENITATGCLKSDSVKITVNALPTPTPGSATAICNGSSATIGGTSTSGHTYSWTSNPGGYSSTSSSASVSPALTTTYNVTETITSTGCSKSDSVKITVNALPTPAVGSASAICSSGTASIGGSSTSGHTYSWTSNPSGFTSTSSSASVSPSSTTTYKLTETITATGCSKSDSVKVTVNIPSTSAAGSNQLLSCGTTSATLGATSPSSGTGAWSKVSGNGSITTTSSNTSTVTGLTSGAAVFRWTVTLGACSNFSEVTIRVNCPATYVVAAKEYIDTLVTGSKLATVSDPDGSITSATLVSGTLPAGTTLGSNGTISVTSLSSLVAGSYPLSITTTDALGGTTTSSITIVLANVADVQLTTNFTNAVLYNGQNYTFTVIAKDNGPAKARGMQIKDVLPSGLTLVSANTTSGSYNSATGVWTPADISNGSTALLEFTVRPNATGTYSNTAFINAADVLDIVKTNDTTSLSNTINNGAEVKVAIATGPIPVTTTTPIKFTIKINNDGPDTAKNVKVYDMLPAGFTYISSAANTGTYSASTGIWTVSSLPKNTTDSLVISAFLNTNIAVASTSNEKLTYVVTVPQSSENFNNHPFLPKFDPTLGTLSKIKITRIATQNTRVKLENKGTAGTISFSSMGRFALSGPGGINFSNSTGTYASSFSASAYDGTTDYAGASGKDFGWNTSRFTDSLIISSGFSNFSGSDSVQFVDSAIGTFSSSPSTNVTSLVSMYGQTQYTVEYFYMPSVTLNSINNPVTISVDGNDAKVLNNFAAARINSATPLPVELVSFTANLKNENVELNWITATEINNDHFEIERSVDGSQFTKIGEKKGFGTSNIEHTYTYEDFTGSINTNVLYYRLKQVDFNGAFEFSPIRKVVLSAKADEFKAWYNRDLQKLQMNINANGDEISNLVLIDMNGKIIASQTINIHSGYNAFQLDMEGLRQGVYVLHFGAEKTVKIVKY